MERFKISRICLVLLIVLGLYFEPRADHLPYRKELSPDVGFWKKVFTEVSSNQYIIHDSQYLSIIYTIVTFDPALSERRRQKQLRGIKKKYEDLLWRFHYNEKDTVGLDLWEKRIFDKFKAIHESNKFRNAARRVRAQQGIREKFVEGLERSFAYLPMMEKIFSRFNLPRELVYMPHIESSFAINAASRVGAKGMWQFMWSTARYFLKMNRSVDQRFDPIYSTEAAAKLLKRNYDELQDWALAVTAYNHGLAGMKRAKRKFDGDYMKIREGYLRRSFGFASKNFYPEFLAVVDIMDSLDHYFPTIEQHPVFVFNEITLSKAVNLPRFARKSNLDLNELKWLNPSFKRGVWNGTSLLYSGYELRVPENANIEEALALLGMAKAAPPTPGEENDQSHNEVADRSINISFSKPGVNPGNSESTITPSFLASFEESPREIKPVTFAATFKPGVETNTKIAVKETLLAEWFHSAPPKTEVEENLLAVSFSKPGVNPAEIGATRFLFNPGDEETLRDQVVGTVASEEPSSSGASENLSESGQIANASYSVSLNDIRKILRQRLQVQNGKIVIFPHETIGHIAEWTGLSAGYIRSLNNLHYGQKIYSGQELRINFSHVSPEQLIAKRLAYHLDLIKGMLNGKSELQLVEYKVNPGENLWNISRRQFDFPVNLLLYFNDLNKLERLYPGDIIKLPVI